MSRGAAGAAAGVGVAVRGNGTPLAAAGRAWLSLPSPCFFAAKEQHDQVKCLKHWRTLERLFVPA